MRGPERGMPQSDVEDVFSKRRDSTSSLPRTEPFRTSSLHTVSANGHQLELPSRPGSRASDNPDVLDVLSRDVKRMMDTIQRLRILGFETSVVSLPKIVVIGDQSTGKSSVIEAISDIKVPRAVGTCTRCPLEINLTQSDMPWSCKVYLSRRYSFNPGAQSVSKNRPYGPWQDLDQPEELEFATLTDKSEVADAITWAQRATLSPGLSYQLFQPGHNTGVDQPEEVGFSPNVIRLDISGPGLPNLAFYDLPGLISHVERDSDQYLLRLVENLAKDYMRSEETLILLTLTMNHDVQNSKAAGLVQKAKADHRTLGVFTKPDLLSPDARDMFASVFAGTTFKRELGYFAVKNNPDARVDYTTARNEEKAFFESWQRKFPCLYKHKKRFGTEPLTQELSRQLVKRITSSLPKIQAIVEEKVKNLEEKLHGLPKPPSGNFSLEVATSLSHLLQDLKSIFNPDAEEFHFFQSWSRLNEKFCNDLRQSHPVLVLTTDSSNNSLAATSRSPSVIPSREVMIIDDDDEETASTPTLRARATPARTTQPKRRREDSQADTNKRQRTDHARQAKKTFTLAQVRELISRKNDTGLGLRGLDNPRVTKDIFSQSVGHWEPMTVQHLNQTQMLCGKSVMTSVRAAFQKQRDTRLFEKIEKDAKTFLVSAFNEHKEFAKRCLKMEKIMYTMNDAASGHVKKECLRELREERSRQLLEDDDSLSEVQRQKKLAAASKIKAEGGEDEYEAELQQMATVRGYYDYASTRFAENTALSFRSEVFTTIRDNLCQHLTKELRLEEEDANSYLGGLLEMDPSIAKERARCEQELGRLRQGLDQLERLKPTEPDDNSWDTMSTQSTVL